MKKYIDDMLFSADEKKHIQDIMRYGDYVKREDFFRGGCNITYYQIRYDYDDKLYNIWLLNGEILNFKEV